MEWICFELGLCIFECICLFVCFEEFCEKKNMSKGLLIAYIMICAFCSYCKDLLHLNNIWLLLGSIIIIYAEISLIFMASRSKRIIYAIIFLVCVGCIDLIVRFGVGVIQAIFFHQCFIDDPTSRVLIAICSKFCLLKFIWIISKYFKKDKDDFPKPLSRLVICVFLFSILSIYTLVQIDSNMAVEKYDYINVYLCITAICLFIANLTIYYVVNQLNTKLKNEKNYVLIQYQNEALINSALQNKESEQEWRKMRHDFNNHISCIDMLLQMNNVEKARLYIKNMNANYQGQYIGVHVGDEIMDAVINQKYMLAKKNDIKFTVNGYIEAPITLEQMDLCALLANSLDNAIEASIQITEKEKRYIILDIKQHKSNLLIEVSNSVREDIEIGRELHTTKKDRKRHGIGMMSMKTIAEKNGGNLEWKCENNQFVLSILVKNI